MKAEVDVCLFLNIDRCFLSRLCQLLAIATEYATENAILPTPCYAIKSSKPGDWLLQTGHALPLVLPQPQVPYCHHLVKPSLALSGNSKQTLISRPHGRACPWPCSFACSSLLRECLDSYTHRIVASASVVAVAIREEEHSAKDRGVSRVKRRRKE